MKTVIFQPPSSMAEFDPITWLGVEPIDVLIGLIGAVLVPFAISTASIWIPQARVLARTSAPESLAIDDFP